MKMRLALLLLLRATHSSVAAPALSCRKLSVTFCINTAFSFSARRHRVRRGDVGASRPAQITGKYSQYKCHDNKRVSNRRIVTL